MERQTEEAAGGTIARSRRKEGAGFEKVVTVSHEPPLAQGQGEPVKRKPVSHLRSLLVHSERRACRIAGADRKMARYLVQRYPETLPRGRLRELASELQMVRLSSAIFGYLRLLGCFGARPSTPRLTRSIGSALRVRKRKDRSVAIGSRAPILMEARANTH